MSPRDDWNTMSAEERGRILDWRAGQPNYDPEGAPDLCREPGCLKLRGHHGKHDPRRAGGATP